MYSALFFGCIFAAFASWFLATEYNLTCTLPGVRDLSIDSLQALLSNGTITSEQLVQTYLARIEEVNHETHAVLEINPTALQDARALDQARRAGTIKRFVRVFLDAQSFRDPSAGTNSRFLFPCFAL